MANPKIDCWQDNVIFLLCNEFNYLKIPSCTRKSLESYANTANYAKFFHTCA